MPIALTIVERYQDLHKPLKGRDSDAEELRNCENETGWLVCKHKIALICQEGRKSSATQTLFQIIHQPNQLSRGNHSLQRSTFGLEKTPMSCTTSSSACPDLAFFLSLSHRKSSIDVLYSQDILSLTLIGKHNTQG